MNITKKNAKEIAIKGWRKRRGIKLVVSIKPHKNGLNQATAEFEGGSYHAFGKTNPEALDKLFKNHLLKLDI